MFKIRIAALLLPLLCLLGAATGVRAAQVDSGSVYCFTQEDFSPEEGPLAGICITQLPEGRLGTIMLGTRILRPGDILTAGQAEQMTFCPLSTQEDALATISYLPIYSDHVAPAATTTIAIRGKQDKAPVAEDSALETYKNLENTGVLKVRDPEGQPLTYSVIRQPKRGSVTVGADGSFTYTPKKNKVGIDSFTYSAADPAGNVSREATVTITILKPSDATQYTDTAGQACRFPAEWMKNTGIFIGEQIGGAVCFQPEKQVTRGEFLTMLVKTLNLPVDDGLTQTGYTDSIPQWLQPYVAAAVRAGLTAGLPERECFDAWQAITGGEAAVMLQNALDLSGEVSRETTDAEIPVWAADALEIMNSNGVDLPVEGALTRAQAAHALYRISGMLADAPGMQVIRSQQARS